MKPKYYSLKNILAKHCQYNLIIGERSNGKSFAIEDLILKNYCDTGKQGALIRRWGEDFKSKRALHMFDNIVNNNKVTKYTHGKYQTIIYVNGAWYLANYDEHENKYIKDEIPFCFSFALSDMEHDKSVSYPNVTIIFFDEFLTRGYYLNDEFIVFMNVLSSIIRDRNDVVIFMCGNTVNKYSPYFSEFGLTHIREMKKGDIDVYSYGDSGLKLAVEFSDTPSKKKQSDIYFAFNNPKLQMITNGTWEIDNYPHLPIKYRPKDICFTFFIVFGTDILQCEIIAINSDMFVYVHKKTTELKQLSSDIIYNLQSNSSFNLRYCFTRPIDKIDNKILYLYKANKFFYQDNETGEILHNFIMSANKGVI